jgi:2-polyprenyl-3-methyl-5-hydroxy-6-metoxy-1,4-benzoquinol methylase
MAQTPHKDFDTAAAQWDANPGRVKLAHEVAAAIIREIKLSDKMDTLDFGCGTGLLTLQLQPFIKSITGADSSSGMLNMLENKIAAQELANVHTRRVDFESGAHVNGGYDLIVSSMVVHHVPDTADLFKEWFDLLHPGGQIAFADLDSEDGSFHGDNTGVFHQGFDREKLRQLLQNTGFQDIRDTTATTMSKEVPGQGLREFPIFLISARKNS